MKLPEVWQRVVKQKMFNKINSKHEISSFFFSDKQIFWLHQYKKFVWYLS